MWPLVGDGIAQFGARIVLEIVFLNAQPTEDRPPDEILKENLPLVERISRRVGRRYGLSGADVDDFFQEVQLKLIEDGYRRISEFRGGSTFKTYLTTVIVRLAKDYCNHLWGKWRPSAAAQRLGWEAELLERLMYREGFSFEESAEKIRRHYQVTRSRVDLEKLAAQLPRRTSRRFEGEEALANAPAPANPGDRVDRRIVDEEKALTAERVEVALQGALQEVVSEDRLILRLYYRGWTLAKIARLLKTDQKPLYRRRDRLLAQLRQTMEARGIDPEDVRRIVGWERLNPKIDYGEDDEEDSG